MTLAELNRVLQGTGIPFAYHHWPDPPAFPYGVYLGTYSNNFAADDTTYLEVEHVQVELYTEKRDIVQERKVADALTAAGLMYEKTMTYIEETKSYQTVFEIEV